MGNPAKTISRTGTSPAGCGFTLIELILVCAVLGMLLVASIPRFQQTAQRLRLEQRAFELTQLLRYAHEQAVSQGREVVWVWDAQARRARIEPGEAEGSGEPADGGERPDARFAESAPLPSEAALSVQRQGKPVDCRCIRFFPNGTSESTTLTVGLEDHVYTVTVHEATSQVLLAAGSAPR